MADVGISPTIELRPYLARFGRRLRLRDGWLLAQRSLWAACLAAVLIQGAGRLWPISNLGPWTLAPLALWLSAVVGVSLFRPAPMLHVARRVDAELGLKERLATAYGLQVPHVFVGHVPRGPSFRVSSSSPHLVTLQRWDALSVAQGIEPRRAFPLPWLRRSLLAAGLLLVVAAVLIALPNRMDAVLEERAEVARVAEEQAERIEQLQEEIEGAQELTPAEREELLQKLAELAEKLRDNRGDREKALADLSRLEEALGRELDPNADARQAALAALAAQLRALAGDESGREADPAEALKALAEKLAQANQAHTETWGERGSLAESLARMAARAAQVGDIELAQALATLAQAAQSDDAQATSQAAQAAAEAMRQAQGELNRQAAIQRVLSQLQQSRQAMAQAGQGQSGQAMAQMPGSGQSSGQGQNQGSGQSQGQGPGQGQQQGLGPGQGQGKQGTGGQGTKADTLPPGTGQGQARPPQGEARPGGVGELDQQVYVPWERRPESGDQISIPGQDSGQGETEVRERKDPLPGSSGPALVPYHEVYYEYLDATNQAMEQTYIPSGLKDIVRAYFSRLEP